MGSKSKKSAQSKLMALITRVANVVTPDSKGNVPLSVDPIGRGHELAYLAGRMITLARKVFKQPSAKGTKRAAAH